MPKSRVFISFDWDDRSVKEGLVAQARDPASPFEFVDNSIPRELPERWAAEARRFISASDFVAVLCGLQSHQSKGRFTELQIAREERKPYFLLRATRSGAATRPKSAGLDEPIYPGTWATIAALLRGERPTVP